MYLILITQYIVYTLISEFTVKNTFLCKYLYTDKTYGQKTCAMALTKDIYE